MFTLRSIVEILLLCTLMAGPAASDSRSDPTSGSKAAIGAYQQGLESLDEGRYLEAARQLQNAIEIDPTFAHAYRDLGKALIMVGSNDEAVEVLRRAIQLDPNDELSYLRMGAALANMGDHTRAVDAFSQAVRLDPTFYEAWTNVGTSLDLLERDDQAAGAFQKAIELNPMGFEGYAGLGRLYNDHGMPQDALKELLVAERLAPENSRVAGDIGHALLGLGRTDEAETYYVRSVELDPNDAIALHNLGNVYFVQAMALEGREEDATDVEPSRSPEAIALYNKGEEWFRNALHKDPGLVRSQGALAETLIKLGVFDEAHSLYGEVLHKVSDPYQVEFCRTRMASLAVKAGASR